MCQSIQLHTMGGSPDTDSNGHDSYSQSGCTCVCRAVLQIIGLFVITTIILILKVMFIAIYYQHDLYLYLYIISSLLDLARGTTEKVFFSLEPLHANDVIKEDMYKNS